MSKMTIKVSFLAGTDIRTAVIEAREKANMFQVNTISFNFNGIECHVKGDSNISKIAEIWEKTMQENNPRICFF